MSHSENVHILNYLDKTIYLLGTAHVSQKSIDETKELIAELKPDTVCVELCETRYNAMMDQNRWKKLDIFTVIKEKKGLFLLSNLALGAMQRNLSQKFGVEPGGEFKQAINSAKEINAKLVLADRDIQATLKRTWSNLSLYKRSALFTQIIESLFDKTEVSEIDIEKMKEGDQLKAMMATFIKQNPSIYKTLIDERDQFLMSAIQESEGQVIVAIIGAGHIPGMKTYLGKTIDRAELSKIPVPSKLNEIWQWIIPALLVFSAYLAYSHTEGKALSDLLYAWILPTSIFASLFTLAAGAHILTILTAFIMAPICSINPALVTGFFTAYVQAKLRKPTVDDCERIPVDTINFLGVYKNPFTRVLLIFVLSNLGTAIGTFLGLSWLISLI